MKDQPIRVLVVDDDPFVAEIISAVVRLVADDVQCAGSIDETRALLRRWDFKVILLDLSLRDSSPKRTLSVIEELRRGGATVYVITGAEVDDSLYRAAIDAGATDVLEKGGLAFDRRLQVLVSGGKPRWTRRAHSGRLAAA